EQALDNIDQALIAAVDDVEEVRGDIKVNCVGGYLGEVIIADLVNEFMQLYPDISISLDFSSNRVDLIEDAFDIAFRMGSLEDAGFIARKLLDIEMGTLASPEYFARKGKPSHPKDLIHHDCLTGSVRKWSFQALDDTKKTVDVHVTGRLQCKNGRVLVQGAKSGNGIIRVPTIYCLQELNDGQLLQVFEEWVVPKVDFSAIYHRDRYQPSRIRTFIDFVKERFEQMPVS
ncbi:LysR family transcriptional regulator, partial [Vibrio splendidus]